MQDNMRLSFRVFSKQVVENAKSCTPCPGITLFVTPISRERIGWFPMLKLRTHFAIDSQKDLNAQAPNHPRPPALESTESTSKSGALSAECAQGNRNYLKSNQSNL
jgi:hypothetical protein